MCHDDVITWKRYLRYWSFVHRSTADSTHKGSVTQNFVVFFVVSLKYLLNKNSRIVVGLVRCLDANVTWRDRNPTILSRSVMVLILASWLCLIVRRAGLLWSQQDFEWRWSVPLFKCLTVLEFSFILFDLCLLITFFNFIMNYVPIVTFWIFTYHKIWILSIMFCFIWSYWIIYFLACLEVSWTVVS